MKMLAKTIKKKAQVTESSDSDSSSGVDDAEVI